MRAIIHPRVRNVKYMIIYKATNLINNKVYIGQTINTLEYRKSQHIRDAKLRPRNIYFHNAINKYGSDNFTFEIIDTANDINELNKKEAKWIRFYNSTNEKYGYNLDSGGKNNKKSKKTKELIGQSTKERWKNPEIALKMRNGLRKGVESQKKNIKRVNFICPYCHKTIQVIPSIAKKRKCCKDCLPLHLSLRADRNKQRENMNKYHEERYEQIRAYTIQWCQNNINIIKYCPYNKINTTLKPLLKELQDKYNVNDIRTLCLSFHTKSRKELLNILKNILNENIC